MDDAEKIDAAFNAPITLPGDLEDLARSQLEHAVDGARRGLKVYESLRSLNDVIGTQYGDRVLYELLQNAHDAHDKDMRDGEVAVHLVIRSATEGELRVANRGRGFSFGNLDAIRNIGTSNKEIGESIGNKGLGFRSIEALTDDVHVFSQVDASPAQRFDGYCFRFATKSEILQRLSAIPGAGAYRAHVAETIPRYLVAVAPDSQPEAIENYARAGFATVVVLPLKSAEAIDLARQQVVALDSAQAPLMLFLQRLAGVHLRIDEPKGQGRGFERILRRRSKALGVLPALGNCVLESVDLDHAGRYLVIRRTLDKTATLQAVERSIPQAPQLARWLQWQGDPEIAVAVADGGAAIRSPRFYNFLAMDAAAAAPLAGFVDAPFFADIDRRNLKLDLPLNKHLLEQVADTCVGAALAAIAEEIVLPPEGVVDLLGWDADRSAMISGALMRRGQAVRTSSIWPTLEGAPHRWTSLSLAVIWPDSKLKVMSAHHAAEAGAPILSSGLGAARLARIRALAAQYGATLKPPQGQLASWAGRLAQTLRNGPRTRPKDWATFYDELAGVFSTFALPLASLQGHKILLSQEGELFEALAVATTVAPPVFVKARGRARRGVAAGPPSPPSSLSRKLRFLSEAIELPEGTIHAFRQAGLCRLYDPVEVLMNLEATLGRKPTDARCRDALGWAFRVWSAGSQGVEAALKAARLRVPTLDGWTLASEASFSTGWTPMGQVLETYLSEAAPLSRDCQIARGRLLSPWADWPAATGQTPGDWRRFLDRLEVRDGLRPIRGEIQRSGTYNSHWYAFLTHGAPAQGFDEAWTASVKGRWLQFPQTEYLVRGEAWRIPGQLEHDGLPDAARARLSELISAYLRAVGDRDFTFELSPANRPDRDTLNLPTPLRIFLQTGAWMAIYRGDEVAFRIARDCWASRAGRQPPRLVDRFSVETAAGVPPILFDARVGLGDWSDPAAAAARLSALARALPTLSSSDRRDFRDHYRRAWGEVTEGALVLEAEPIVVERAGSLQALPGDAATPQSVYLTREPHGFAARTLNDRNEPVLDIGDADMAVALKLISATGRYRPVQAEEGGVSLRIDGEVFAPTPLDPLLVATPGLEWLPDAVVLAYETLGDPLEMRNVSSQVIDRRIRSVRVHRCATISLKVGEREVEAAGADRIQPFHHPDHPTLILADNRPLDWPLLLQAAPALGKLLGSGVKSFEFLLLRLNNDRISDTLARPSDERLAEALGRGVELVREHFAAIDGGLERQVRAILPVVHYLGGDDLVGVLRAVAEKSGPRLDLAAWLADHATIPSAADILDVCGSTEDFAQVQRMLSLDFGKFNRSLLALGLPGLNNRADLERLFEVYLNEMRGDLVDRVRRRRLADFRAHLSLEVYLSEKALGFASFKLAWLDEVAMLDRDTVRAHVLERAETALGPDAAIPLASLADVLASNRKLLAGRLADLATLIAVWREHNPAPNERPWPDGDVQSLARRVEQGGVLDFEILEASDVPPMLARLGLWPARMQVTDDAATLGVSPEDLKREREKANKRRRDEEVSKRAIHFNGAPLDPLDGNFELSLAAAALKGLEDHPDWLARSRPQRLVVQAAKDPSKGGGGPGGSGGAGRNQPPEATRRAMGLASELLAREYLRRRFPAEMSDKSWVSSNRFAYCPDWKGDDALGYDFRVVTARNEWLFEVKSALDAGGEFEFTANELRVAGSAALERKRRYRILYVPFVFDPKRWCVQVLSNPAAEQTRNRFRVVRTGSVRYSFERR